MLLFGLALTAAAAYAAGALTYRAGVHSERADLAVRPTAAVLLAPSQPARATLHRGVPAPPAVPARWVDGRGREHTGHVHAPAGRPAGSTLPVWVAVDGTIMDRPLTRTHTLIRTAYAAAGILAIGGLLVYSGRRLTRRLILHRRLAAWEAEWNTIGPLWTRHP